jgi:hypothetical protein
MRTAESRFWMSAVEPDVRFRRLAQVIGLDPIMYNTEMLIVPAWVGTGPSNNSPVVEGQLELWPIDDLDVLNLVRRGQELRER